MRSLGGRIISTQRLTGARSYKLSVVYNYERSCWKNDMVPFTNMRDTGGGADMG